MTPGSSHVFERGGETLPPVALRLAEPPRVRRGSIKRRTLESVKIPIGLVAMLPTSCP